MYTVNKQIGTTNTDLGIGQLSFSYTNLLSVQAIVTINPGQSLATLSSRAIFEGVNAPGINKAIAAVPGAACRITLDTTSTLTKAYYEKPLGCTVTSVTINYLIVTTL